MKHKLTINEIFTLIFLILLIICAIVSSYWINQISDSQEKAKLLAQVALTWIPVCVVLVLYYIKDK